MIYRLLFDSYFSSLTQSKYDKVAKRSRLHALYPHSSDYTLSLCVFVSVSPPSLLLLLFLVVVLPLLHRSFRRHLQHRAFAVCGNQNSFNFAPPPANKQSQSPRPASLATCSVTTQQQEQQQQRRQQQNLPSENNTENNKAKCVNWSSRRSFSMCCFCFSFCFLSLYVSLLLLFFYLSSWFSQPLSRLMT